MKGAVSFGLVKSDIYAWCPWLTSNNLFTITNMHQGVGSLHILPKIKKQTFPWETVKISSSVSSHTSNAWKTKTHPPPNESTNRETFVFTKTHRYTHDICLILRVMIYMNSWCETQAIIVKLPPLWYNQSNINYCFYTYNPYSLVWYDLIQNKVTMN